MAIVHVTTTNGAVTPGERAALAAELATLTCEAEGFTGSALAPTLCWTCFDERPRHAFSTGTGAPARALYYVTITILAGAISRSAKRELGAGITAAVLGREGSPPTPDNRNRVWIRFIDVADGDLIVGGEATFLAGLRALVGTAGRTAAVDAIPATWPATHTGRTRTMSDISDPAAFPYAFDDAMNAGDLERLVALYDENAVLRVRSGGTRSGLAAVREEMGHMIAAGATITNSLRHVFRHEDVALIIVDYVLRLEAPDGSPVEVTGTATNVLRQHPGEGWRLIVANPQGTAPDAGSGPRP